MVALKYLLDTNIVSEPVRPKPNPAVLSRLQKHQSELAMVSVVWHELLFGFFRLPDSAKRTAIETYLNEVVLPALTILPYDRRAARWHALERARLTGMGKTPPFVDGQVAAVAKVNGLILVTMNVSDYVHFEGVQIENWAEG